MVGGMREPIDLLCHLSVENIAEVFNTIALSGLHD